MLVLLLLALSSWNALAGPVICRPLTTYPCTKMKVFSVRKLEHPETRCLVELKELETELFHRVYLKNCPDEKEAHYIAIEVTCNPQGLDPSPPDAMRIYPASACETPPGDAKRKQVEAMVAEIKPGDRLKPLLEQFTKLYRVYDHTESFEENPNGEDYKFTKETWIFHEYPGFSIYVPVAAKIKHGLHAPRVENFFVAGTPTVREEFVAKRECEDWGGTAKKKGPDLYEYTCRLPKNPKLQRR